MYHECGTTAAAAAAIGVCEKNIESELIIVSSLS